MRESVIYGDVDRRTYIVEVVGCGVAIFDFDGDEWMDLLLPNCSTSGPAATKARARGPAAKI